VGEREGAERNEPAFSVNTGWSPMGPFAEPWLDSGGCARPCRHRAPPRRSRDCGWPRSVRLFRQGGGRGRDCPAVQNALQERGRRYGFCTPAAAAGMASGEHPARGTWLCTLWSTCAVIARAERYPKNKTQWARGHRHEARGKKGNRGSRSGNISKLTTASAAVRSARAATRWLAPSTGGRKGAFHRKTVRTPAESMGDAWVYSQPVPRSAPAINSRRRLLGHRPTASYTDDRTMLRQLVLSAGFAAAAAAFTPGASFPSGFPRASNSSSTTTRPVSSEPCPTICADYINECGAMYGGCFPDPKCTGGTAWPTFTPPPCTTTTSTSSEPCPTICADYINECGAMYGGCFPDPKCTGGTAWPTFTPPPCTTTTSTSSEPCPTICADYINECGAMYGGCFPDPKCTGGTAWPTFTPPPCTTTSTSSEPCPTICADYINECGAMYGGCFPDPKCTGGTAWPTFTPPPCTTTTSTSSEPCPTICADYINECGAMYGGCFPDPKCTGGTAWPTFTPPPCTNTTTTTTRSNTSTKPCRTICADYVNPCGYRYGGCYADPRCNGGVSPTFSTPPCTPTPTATTTSSCPTVCTGYPNTCGGTYKYCMSEPKCTGGTETEWPTFSPPACNGTASTAPVVTKLAVRTVRKRAWMA